MDREAANKLYREHASAMACVAVTDANGDSGIGTAFHVGDGVFLTARHVVEGKSISSLKLTEHLLLPPEEAYPELSTEQIEQWTKALGFTPYTRVPQPAVNLASGPYFHPNETIDVAAFKVDAVHPRLAVAKLGRHLDDRIMNEDWVLSEAIVLGYPPIPMTASPYLVAARAELNAIVSFRHSHGVN
jgi:hypothetical protein